MGIKEITTLTGAILSLVSGCNDYTLNFNRDVQKIINSPAQSIQGIITNTETYQFPLVKGSENTIFGYQILSVKTSRGEIDISFVPGLFQEGDSLSGFFHPDSCTTIESYVNKYAPEWTINPYIDRKIDSSGHLIEFELPHRN